MAQNMSSGSLISKIGSYLQIVTSDPRSTAFVPLAEAYCQIGLLDDALEVARLGTQALPHFSPGFATLGRVLGQMGRIDEAMAAFAHALSIDCQSQAALIGMARLHLILSERDQARKILQQTAEFHPHDVNVRNMLVALDLPRPWDRLRRAQEAPTAAAPPDELPAAAAPPEEPVAVAGSEPKSILTATLAEIYVKQGLPDKAVAVYEEILKQDPHNQAARERLADLLTADEPAPRAEDKMAAAVLTESADGAAEAPVGRAPAVEPPRRSALATLESWLVYLKQRREHVH